MLYKTYFYSFNVAYRYKKMNDKFLHDMLVNRLYGGIRTSLFVWWTITVEPVLKGPCIERQPWNSPNKQLIPTKCIHVFLWLVLSQKCDILFQKHLWCKKGKAKKVQVTEWIKGVKSLWGQEEKIYQQGCVEL